VSHTFLPGPLFLSQRVKTRLQCHDDRLNSTASIAATGARRQGSRSQDDSRWPPSQTPGPGPIPHRDADRLRRLGRIGNRGAASSTRTTAFRYATALSLNAPLLWPLSGLSSSHGQASQPAHSGFARTARRPAARGSSINASPIPLGIPRAVCTSGTQAPCPLRAGSQSSA
jgi:hypothetical protein